MNISKSTLWAIWLTLALWTQPVNALESVNKLTTDQQTKNLDKICKILDAKELATIPKGVCEISTDNGKTWKEYIPNSTSKIAGGLAWLLALIAAGMVLIRGRKRDEFAVDPSIKNKYTSTIEPKNNISPKNEWENIALNNSKAMLAQAMGAIPEYQWIDHVMQQEDVVDHASFQSSWTVTPIEKVDILIDWGRKNTLEIELLIEIPDTNIATSNKNEWIIITDSEVENIWDIRINEKNLSSSIGQTKNIVQQDIILGKLQWKILDTKAIKKLNDSLPGGESYKRIYLPQKNATLRYWFNISEDEKGIVNIDKDHKNGFIYYVDADWKIQETVEYSLGWVKVVYIIEDWYLEFIVGNNFERKVIFFSKERISLD